MNPVVEIRPFLTNCGIKEIVRKNMEDKNMVLKFVFRKDISNCLIFTTG